MSTYIYIQIVVDVYTYRIIDFGGSTPRYSSQGKPERFHIKAKEGRCVGASQVLVQRVDLCYQYGVGAGKPRCDVVWDV